MTNMIVLDLEIQDSIIYPHEWDQTQNMKISCCCVYNYNHDRYEVYGPNDVDTLRNMLIMSDRVIGYNVDKFDIPIILGIPRMDYDNSIKTYDILAEIWKSLDLDPKDFSDAHKGYSLDTVCKYTLGIGKEFGHGAEAPFLYKSGNIWRVINYCLNDVTLTKKLYEHIQMYGYIKNRYNHVTVKYR